MCRPIAHIMLPKVLLLLVLAGEIATARTTKAIIALNRHGSRYSYSSVERKEVQGQLSNNGIRQSYGLGRYLRHRYADFFPKRFNFNNNFILASESSRCRQTAQGIMMGLYDLGSLDEELAVKKEFFYPQWRGFVFDSDLKTALPRGFQPVPVHSLAPHENYAFKSWFAEVCPKIASVVHYEDKKAIAPIIERANALLPKLQNSEFNYRNIVNKDKMTSIREFSAVTDFIISQHGLGKKLGLDEATFSEVERLHIAMINHGYFRDLTINRYIFTEHATYVVKELEEVQKRLKNGESVNRFYLMSGHDINLTLYLVIAGLVETDCVKPDGKCTLNPPFASVITFEVYEEEKQHYVEAAYNGDPIPWCQTLEGNRCTLDQFIDVLRGRMLPGDLQELRYAHCRPKPFSKNRALIAIISLNCIIGLILIYLTQKAKTG